VLDSLSRPRSTVTEFALHELENGGQLAPNVSGQPPMWIVPPAADREPNLPFGYVVSFVRHHERGFAAPGAASCAGCATTTAWMLAVNSCMKVHLDLQADKSPVVVKGPFFPRVVNPRYRIRGAMCNARIKSSKAR
jgi:hypothetical protein